MELAVLRAKLPFWRLSTVVNEIEYQITLAGNEKSCLDGFFAQLLSCKELSTAESHNMIGELSSMHL
jgi:hypothetical protein